MGKVIAITSYSIVYEAVIDAERQICENYGIIHEQYVQLYKDFDTEP